MIFFAPGTPIVHGPGCPPAPPSDPWYGGLGVLLGESEAWKPQEAWGTVRSVRAVNVVHAKQKMQKTKQDDGSMSKPRNSI